MTVIAEIKPHLLPAEAYFAENGMEQHIKGLQTN